MRVGDEGQATAERKEAQCAGRLASSTSMLEDNRALLLDAGFPKETTFYRIHEL